MPISDTISALLKLACSEDGANRLATANPLAPFRWHRSSKCLLPLGRVAVAAPAVSPSARSLAIQTCVSTREPVQVGRSQPASTLEQQQGGRQHRHERADAKKEIGFQRLYVVNHSIECSSPGSRSKSHWQKDRRDDRQRFMTCDCVRLADGSFLPSMQGKGTW